MTADQLEAELGVLTSKVVGELDQLTGDEGWDETLRSRAWEIIHEAMEVAASGCRICEWCHLPYRTGWAHTPGACWLVEHFPGATLTLGPKCDCTMYNRCPTHLAQRVTTDDTVMLNLPPK